MKKNLSTSSSVQEKPFRANTLMGQHFLRSPDVAGFIADAADIKPTDTILEIGPGKGVLTEKLSTRAGRIIAVEKDPRLVTHMRDNFSKTKLEVIEGDILKVDLASILPAHYKLVANIPYYITAKILRTFLEPPAGVARPETIVLMVQYEVARRITAEPPDMNLLGLSVQVYGKPRIAKRVSRTYFKPQPAVDSAVIAITDISDAFFRERDIDPKHFFELAKKAFGSKRKKLSNTLGIASDKRPQHLTLEEWGEIAKG
ncbi:MAG: 16S rRNA (adenine(1518)-N(6)/adenine(1519)-N(6))-dimethyltransferase RsmA [Patescibacteria group bacterium]